MINKSIEFLDKAFHLIGALCALLLVLTAFNIIYDVVMRYVFNDVSIALQELEWHLFAATFLLGISYSLKHDGHVRVDFLYEKMSPTLQAWINIVGVLVFVIPISLLIIWYGIDFATEAYTIGERSGDPGGLTQRWIIKAIIPFSFVLVIFAALHMLLTNIQKVRL